MSAEGGIAALGAQNIATQEKHQAEGMPAFVQQQAATAQNAQQGVNPAQPHHEAPIKYYGVDPRDKEIEMKLALNQLAQAGKLPTMISDNKDVASWAMEKAKIAEADQWINELLTFYDQTDLNSKRWFDAKFPFIKQLKLKRIREVGAMHIRLAELAENADPTPEEVKYIIDLLQGKAKLPPPLLPKDMQIPSNEDAGNTDFIEGMFNPFRFTNPIDTRQKKAVVEALGTNVLGKGFVERWSHGRTHMGPQSAKDWVEYFVGEASQDARTSMSAAGRWNLGGTSF